MGKLLTSLPTLVQSPFIIVTIGGVTFGSYTNEGNTLTGRVTYPNYMKSVSINKVNGTVNTYTLNFFKNGLLRIFIPFNAIFVFF